MGYTFLPSPASNLGSGITGKDDFYSIVCRKTPVHDLTDGNINSAIGGKATFEAMKQVVELIGCWRNWQTVVERKKMDPLEKLLG